MRLTESMKDKIIRKVVNTTFATRKIELDRREEMLALAIRDMQMTRDEWEMVEALPAKFFYSGQNTFLNVVQHRESGSNLFHRLDYPKDARVPKYLDQGSIQFDDLTKPLQDEVRAYVEARKDISTEEGEFEAQTKGVVRSFGTSEKLLEAWPTLRELMPEGFFVPKDKPTLPVTTINNLDAALQATRPFETENA